MEEHLLAQRADQVAAGRFWDQAIAAGLESALANRQAMDIERRISNVRQKG